MQQSKNDFIISYTTLPLYPYCTPNTHTHTHTHTHTQNQTVKKKISNINQAVSRQHSQPQHLLVKTTSITVITSQTMQLTFIPSHTLQLQPLHHYDRCSHYKHYTNNPCIINIYIISHSITITDVYITSTALTFITSQRLLKSHYITMTHVHITNIIFTVITSQTVHQHSLYHHDRYIH